LSEQRYCDFCGRSEIALLAQAPFGLPVLEPDEADFWVCYHYRAKLVLPPVGEETADLVEELRPLAVKSAGAICHKLNLPYEPHYRSVIDAASKTAYDEDRDMSAWALVTEWPDWTTVWRAEDRSYLAIVASADSIRLQFC
jgi:hypothetical protein